jgi:hypothetical protein
MLHRIDPIVRTITGPIYAIYHRTPHIEHIGFVALATGEVFHMGAMIFYINLVLMVSGAMAVAYESFGVLRISEAPNAPEVCQFPEPRKGHAHGKE